MQLMREWIFLQYIATFPMILQKGNKQRVNKTMKKKKTKKVNFFLLKEDLQK
jgi:hypothetical protein